MISPILFSRKVSVVERMQILEDFWINLYKNKYIESLKKNFDPKKGFNAKKVSADLIPFTQTSLRIMWDKGMFEGINTASDELSALEFSSLDETVDREINRTLDNQYPSLSRGSLFGEYLDQRSKTASTNLDKYNQEEVKKLTASYLQGKNPKLVKDRIIDYIRKVDKEVSEDKLQQVATYLNGELKKSGTKITLPEGIPLEASIYARDLHSKLHRNAQSYLKSLSTVQVREQKAVASKLLKLQKASRIPVTRKQQLRATKILDDLFLDGAGITDIRKDILDLKRGLITEDEMLDPNKLTNIQLKQEGKVKKLKSKRIELLTKLAKDKSNQSIRTEIANLDKKIKQQESVIPNLRKVANKLQEVESNKTIKPTQAIKIPQSLRKEIAYVRYRGDLSKVPKKATYDEINQIRSRIKEQLSDETVNLNNAIRLGSTEVSSAFNIGRLKVFLDEGVEYVQAKSIQDDRRSVFCASLHNKIFKVYELLGISGLGQTFPRTREPEYSPYNAAIAPRSSTGVGLWLFPAHVYCRSYYVPVTTSKRKQELELANTSSLSPRAAARLKKIQDKKRIAALRELKIAENPNKFFLLRQGRQGNITRQLLTTLTVGSTVSRNALNYGKLVNTGLQILKKKKGPVTQKDEKAIAKALLLAGSILTPAALYFFFSRSNLASSVKSFLFKQGIKSGTKEATQAVDNFLNAKPDETILNLVKKTEEKAKEFDLVERSQRTEVLKELLLGDQRKLSIEKIVEGLSNQNADPDELYAALTGAVFDRLRNIETATKSTLARALSNTNRFTVLPNEIDSIEDLGELYLVRFKKGKGFNKGRPSFASKKAFRDPDYLQVVKEIQSDIDDIERTIEELRVIADQQESKIKSALTKKQIGQLERKVAVLKKYGNTMTYKKVKQQPSPKIKDSEAKLQNDIDNLLTKKELEIDAITAEYLNAETQFNKILKEKLISTSNTNEVLVSGNKQLKEDYIRNVAEAIGEIEETFVDANNEIIDPFAKLSKKTSLGSIIDRLNQLNAIDESYEEVLENLKVSYQDTINSKIKELERLLILLSK